MAASGGAARWRKMGGDAVQGDAARRSLAARGGEVQGGDEQWRRGRARQRGERVR